jgi:two-component system alkaline phosphatase synthesis response regulator PhoP
MIKTRVLIIDDEKENVRYLSTILEENGFDDVHAAYDGEEGLERVKELVPGLILLDLRMPKKSGIAVFNELKDSPTFRDIPVVVLTGEGGFLKHLAELRDFHENGEDLESVPTKEILDRFISSSPDAFLEKPVEPEALMSVIRRVLITVDEVKEKRQNEITALRDRKLAGGVIFKGVEFDSDERTRMNLTAMATKLALPEAVLPADYVWRASDNQEIPMSKEDLLAFHAAVTDWVFQTYRASWVHKAAIEKLTSTRDVERYDIRQGWPDKNLQ